MKFLPIARTAMVALRRDRASLALSFILPISFFSIFAAIFGTRHDTVPRISVILVDEDRSAGSRQLIRGIERDGSLRISTHPAGKSGQPAPPDYTVNTAEAAVKAGDVSVALVIPKGWGEHPMAFGPGADAAQPIQLLYDQSDTIAPQMVGGLLQKAAMTAMPLTMAQQGMQETGRFIGGLTPQQQQRMDANLASLREMQAQRDAEAAAPAGAAPASGAGGDGGGFSGGMIAVENRSVLGEHKDTSMISFYAASIGVMFLLFTATASAGALLDEAESGTLDRVLSSRITITGLLAGKLLFNTLLAFSQLFVMFLWGWAVFKLDFFPHFSGFLVMGLCTAAAVASFGLLLASLCRTRAQLGAVSTLLILTMSAVGGSMFPRYLMPENVQKAGLFTINAWAIDGFTKVFWRDSPLGALWPQVSVLLATAVVLFLIARRIARRWEYA